MEFDLARCIQKVCPDFKLNAETYRSLKYRKWGNNEYEHWKQEFKPHFPDSEKLLLKDLLRQAWRHYGFNPLELACAPGTIRPVCKQRSEAKPKKAPARQAPTDNPSQEMEPQLEDLKTQMASLREQLGCLQEEFEHLQEQVQFEPNLHSHAGASWPQGTCAPKGPMEHSIFPSQFTHYAAKLRNPTQSVSSANPVLNTSLQGPASGSHCASCLFQAIPQLLSLKVSDLHNLQLFVEGEVRFTPLLEQSPTQDLLAGQ